MIFREAFKRFVSSIKIAWNNFNYDLELTPPSELEVALSKTNPKELLPHLESKDARVVELTAEKLINMAVTGQHKFTDEELDMIILARRPNEGEGLQILSDEDLAARRNLIRLEGYAARTKNKELYALLFQVRMQIWKEYQADHA